ncbi:MAG: hypothetical protein AB7E80_17310 [Hyphomicrobiaceae bacterium]
MFELISSLAQRHVVIALAILGAVLVTAGTLMSNANPNAPPRPVPRALTRIGYVLTIASVMLFIAAGFLSSR